MSSFRTSRVAITHLLSSRSHGSVKIPGFPYHKLVFQLCCQDLRMGEVAIRFAYRQRSVYPLRGQAINVFDDEFYRPLLFERLGGEAVEFAI